MQPEGTAITGKEAGKDETPYSALVDFYSAFNSGNMEKMSHNWDNTDTIAMDNPLGGIKRGWSEISPLYEKLFNGPADVYVEFYDYTIHETDNMFYAVGRERGYFRMNGKEVELAIRTSRIFEKSSSGWKQVHHHGSITDPTLLNEYQSAVMNG